MSEENPVDRFDLEQQIMAAWNITDEIDTMYEIIASKGELNEQEEQIANMLHGVSTIWNHKFEQLWHTFEALIQDGKIT